MPGRSKSSIVAAPQRGDLHSDEMRKDVMTTGDSPTPERRMPQPICAMRDVARRCRRRDLGEAAFAAARRISSFTRGEDIALDL